MNTCAKCGDDIPEDAEVFLIYGNDWCATCADDPDQYDSEEDYAKQRPQHPTERGVFG
jgi:hypothetical protein